MARFDLSDAEWAAIRPHLPKQGRGPRRKDDRTVLNGIFYRAPLKIALFPVLCYTLGIDLVWG